MTDWKLGCHATRLPGAGLKRKVDFIELDLASPLPRLPTLRRWRGAIGDDFGVAFVLSRSLTHGPRGPLRLDAQAETELDASITAAHALKAQRLVLRTPADFTPGARDRELLATFVARVREKTQLPIVWSHVGMWTPEEAERVARKLGLVRAFDPLEDDELFRSPSFGYAELRAIGRRSRFSADTLERALEQAAEIADEIYLLIESPRAVAEASLAKKLAHAAGEAAASEDEDQGVEPDDVEPDDVEADDDDADDDEANDDEADDDEADDDDADDDDADDDDADDDDEDV